MILHDLQEQSHRVIAVATDKVHTHALVELPTDLHQVRDIIGQAKRKSSRAVKTKLPGKIWAAGGTFKRVNDRDHLDAAHDYIIYDQGDEAWTWSFRDPSDEGMFKRQRSPEE
jgi:REP element-mobilizing transposase RayT